MNGPDTNWAWPWWTVMVIINVANLGICVYCYRRSVNAPDGHSAYLKRMRIMGLIFTLVALYQAIFVSRYLYQYAWFDTIANSSLLIRTFAWAAELSFAGLIAMAMLRFNTDVSARHRPHQWVSRYAATAPYILIACIFIAQFFATGGLISKSRLLFAIEEPLWSAGFLSILPLAVIQFQRAFSSKQGSPPQSLSMLKTFSAVNLAWCVIYCSYGRAVRRPDSSERYAQVR